jgi:hypothetical protein
MYPLKGDYDVHSKATYLPGIAAHQITEQVDECWCVLIRTMPSYGQKSETAAGTGGYLQPV